jgi:exodeoxyribonuclease-3
MKIISYNVNGIRAAIRKGLLDWLAQEDYDIVCIQETKAHPEQIDRAAFAELGYTDHWFSATRRKGYSGVLTLSKTEPDQVVTGCGIEAYDSEGRILRTDFGDWTVLNCYFPSGTTGSERQALKMQFLDDFARFSAALRQERPQLIIVGDFNIAHNEIDVWSPQTAKRMTGFLPEERAWLSEWFEAGGYVDTFRHLNPDKVQYSWWSSRSNAREQNKGWRLDYQNVSTPLLPHIRAAENLTEIVHSDHCPVLLEIEW